MHPYPKPPPNQKAKTPLPRKTWRHYLVRSVLVLLAIIGTFLIIGRLFGLLMIYQVPSNGMSTEIQSGDQVFVEGFSLLGNSPQRGDVVTFSTEGLNIPDQEDLTYIKRIVGLPGEKLEIIDGSLFINGVKTEIRNSQGVITYSIPSQLVENRLPTVWQIPEEHYFLCGDNTDGSLDSRFYGFVPRSNINGRAMLRYWPPERAGGVK